jgi:hypothetical protein
LEKRKVQNNVIRGYAEFIGILPIVVSLLLLGYEIRQTRLAIIGETALARAMMSTEADLIFADSEFIAPAYIKLAAKGFAQRCDDPPYV